MFAIELDFMNEKEQKLKMLNIVIVKLLPIMTGQGRPYDVWIMGVNTNILMEIYFFVKASAKPHIV